MPSLKLKTNVPRSALPPNFTTEVAEIFQKAINKPLKYVCVCIEPDQLMRFGDSDGPCALVEVISIGNLGVEENEALSKIIFETILLAKLNIDKERAYITFIDQQAHEVGWSATTFHAIRKRAAA